MGCCMSSAPAHRTRRPSAGYSVSCNRPRRGSWVLSLTRPKSRKPREATATTTRMATSANRVALPRGLRMQRRRRPPAWLGLLALLVTGLGLGAALSGAPATIVLGTLAVLIAIAAAIFRPALGLAVLAVSYPFDLTTYAGPLKLTTSEALLLILALALIGRQFARNPPAIERTPLDLPVLLFAAASVLTLLGLTGFYGDQLVALAKAAGGFLLFFVVTQSLREQRDIWIVLAAVLSAALIVAVPSILPPLTVVGAGTALKRAN